LNKRADQDDKGPRVIGQVEYVSRPLLLDEPGDDQRIEIPQGEYGLYPRSTSRSREHGNCQPPKKEPGSKECASEPDGLLRIPASPGVRKVADRVRVPSEKPSPRFLIWWLVTLSILVLLALGLCAYLLALSWSPDEPAARLDGSSPTVGAWIEVLPSGDRALHIAVAGAPGCQHVGVVRDKSNGAVVPLDLEGGKIRIGNLNIGKGSAFEGVVDVFTTLDLYIFDREGNARRCSLERAQRLRVHTDDVLKRMTGGRGL